MVPLATQVSPALPVVSAELGLAVEPGEAAWSVGLAAGAAGLRAGPAVLAGPGARPSRLSHSQRSSLPGRLDCRPRRRHGGEGTALRPERRVESGCHP